MIRTGFGIYYGANQNDDFSDPLESAVPRYSITSTDNPAIQYPITPFITPANALFAPKAIDRFRKDLSYQEWDFLVQQELPGQFQAQVGYIGSNGRHLLDVIRSTSSIRRREPVRSRNFHSTVTSRTIRMTPFKLYSYRCSVV